MSEYTYPLRDADFVISHLLNFDQMPKPNEWQEFTADFLVDVVNEAAKLCEEVIAPLNPTGDQQGATLSVDGVKPTPGFSDAYRQYCEGGWTTLSAREEFGGQNLPNLLSTAINEALQASGVAFGLCPLLSTGAISAIQAHGSPELQQTWLPSMVSGRWTGTMNLTESDAGSDLAAIKTRAIKVDDHYLITGQKIFITWGDHDMTDNIVHLVLARLPDAPAGVKGISLFLVPKFLLDEKGEPAQRNDVKCIALEHKLGLHASPTCTMSFGDEGGAVGYLVGEPNQGLACMFTMMNHARQAVGVQGLGVAERSYQQARQYAKDRLQGTRTNGSRFSIINFPDVRRMLLQMKASIEAMRALAYTAAMEEDKARAADKEAAKQYHARVALYTPIVKAWLTELAQEITYLGTQIHGGMGYIEETGSAQHYRDARILTIYEGTTGIQALDFVGRKVSFDKGAALSALLADIELTLTEMAAYPSLSRLTQQLDQATQCGRRALSLILEKAAENSEQVNAVCVPALMLFGYLCGGWLMAASAIKATQLLTGGQGDTAFFSAKIETANYYGDHLLPRVTQLTEVIARENGIAISFDDEQF